MSERRHLDPIPPGEVLQFEFLQPLGISQNQLARDLDVPPGRINEIIRGRRALTADTALRLELHFGVSAQFWLNLQAAYDLKVTRRRLWPAIASRVRARLGGGEPGARLLAEERRERRPVAGRGRAAAERR